MKRKFLEDLSIDKDVIDKIMTENGNDIEIQKKLATTAIAERDGLKEQLDTALAGLKDFDDVDIDKLKGEITRLSDEIETNQTNYESKLSKIERQRETEVFFNGLEQKFINDETKEYYNNKLEILLDEEKSKGKSRQELLDTLTKNEKGELRANIFSLPDNNPNKVIFPPAGDGIETKPAYVPPKII